MSDQPKPAGEEVIGDTEAGFSDMMYDQPKPTGSLPPPSGTKLTWDEVVAEEPKPGGEWTVRQLSGETFLCSPSDDPDEIFRVDHPNALAKAINATIAAEREERQKILEIMKSFEWRDNELEQLREQLAAEREKREASPGE